MTAAKTNEYPLQFPFEHDGKLIESVVLRRAKGKDLEAMDRARGQGEMATVLVSIACLSDLPIEAVRDMDAEDVTSLAEVIADFLPKEKAKSSKTGGA